MPHGVQGYYCSDTEGIAGHTHVQQKQRSRNQKSEPHAMRMPLQLEFARLRKYDQSP